MKTETKTCCVTGAQRYSGRETRVRRRRIAEGSSSGD